ncbi:MAG TPA: lytic transglycosylase domain-containing protein [Myxococcota bacterium]|nr:lytic transglycosylase domain-containing protein [Myxococcota bacterium]HND29745.1 lytic transglycosylase domain-containing protein [Myxococcota bacterium]HNH48432.1 lytic transglycosylase domain-containing protein [Myxococcota bacterium]
MILLSLLLPLLWAGDIYLVRMPDGSMMLTDTPKAGMDWELWWDQVDPRTNLPRLDLIKDLDSFDAYFVEAEGQHGVPAELLKAVCVAESHMNPKAVSKAGAQGLMQLMPATASALGVEDPFDPRQSIFGGATYLSKQIQSFAGDYRLALAAYNAGPGAVKKHGGIPPFAETRTYVDRVMAIYKHFRDTSPLSSSP